MVSIILFVMAGCLAAPLLVNDVMALAGLATLLAWAFAIWNILLMLGTKSRVSELPQWVLFLGIAIPASASFYL